MTCILINVELPVYRPPNGVLTPLALLTADRENDPFTGIELKKEPIMLHRPNVNISCEASTVFPQAVKNFNVLIF